MVNDRETCPVHRSLRQRQADILFITLSMPLGTLLLVAFSEYRAVYDVD